MVSATTTLQQRFLLPCDAEYSVARCTTTDTQQEAELAKQHEEVMVCFHRYTDACTHEVGLIGQSQLLEHQKANDSPGTCLTDPSKWRDLDAGYSDVIVRLHAMHIATIVE